MVKIPVILIFAFLAGCSIEPTEERFSAIGAKLEGSACVPPATLVVINEFMANPESVADVNGEWIELFNPHGTDVSLSGFHLETEEGNLYIFSDVDLASGGYLTICRNANTQFNGGVICDLEYADMELPDGAGSIFLRDTDGNEIDSILYDSPQVSGKSTALVNPYLDNSYASNLNFKTSSSGYGSGDKGTPGGKNDDVYEMVEVQSQCGDGKFCTHDLCELGKCSNPWKDGCCELNSQCADNDLCTEDICDKNLNKCENPPIEECCQSDSDCTDENPCNKDVCLYNSCRHSNYNVLPGCCFAPEKNPDTGMPWESDLQKKIFADALCGQPGNPCQKFSCNLSINKCELSPQSAGCCIVGADCKDNNPCSVDFCVNGKCIYSFKQNCCWQNSQCADADICTLDLCLYALCHNFPKNTGGCCGEDKDCV
ncbi:MAG: lamin tail domain-containing protein, partial [Deltaproteobacteria bacterium]|nr:lamin tail domain-containing protein [Deltaproteobacteria bacterium]